jgi:hypothetical protein
VLSQFAEPSYSSIRPANGHERFSRHVRRSRPYHGKMRVLLFDIDGTLIRSGGAGKAAMEAGLKSAFGVTEIQDRVAYSGRTDPGIVRELLALRECQAAQGGLSLAPAHHVDTDARVGPAGN